MGMIDSALSCGSHKLDGCVKKIAMTKKDYVGGVEFLGKYFDDYFLPKINFFFDKKEGMSR